MSVELAMNGAVSSELNDPLRERWQALLEQPLQRLPVERLAGCFGGVLPYEQVKALLATPRFHPRLWQLLGRHFQLTPLQSLAESADLPVLLLDAAAFARLPRFCGAVWHAAALTREIRGAAVQTLKAQLGADVFEFALSRRDQAGAADFLLDGEQLIAAIDRDGRACLATWYESRPQPLRNWLRLCFDIPVADVDMPPVAVKLVPQVAAALPATGATAA